VGSEESRAWAGKFRKRAISVFLLFHLVAIPCWGLPFDSLPTLICRALVRPYFLWTGLFQSWDMFAPSPIRANRYLEAMLVYPDGTTDYWAFPRMDRLSFTARYAKERYRKFEEVLTDDKNADMWPDIARYVARQALRGSARPERVLLVLHWSDLEQSGDGSFDATPWQSRVLFSYRVEWDDFH